MSAKDDFNFDQQFRQAQDMVASPLPCPRKIGSLLKNIASVSPDRQEVVHLCVSAVKKVAARGYYDEETVTDRQNKHLALALAHDVLAAGVPYASLVYTSLSNSIEQIRVHDVPEKMPSDYWLP